MMQEGHFGFELRTTSSAGSLKIVLPHSYVCPAAFGKSNEQGLDYRFYSSGFALSITGFL